MNVITSQNGKTSIDVLPALKHWAGQTEDMNDFEKHYAEKEYCKMDALYDELNNEPLYKAQKK